MNPPLWDRLMTLLFESHRMEELTAAQPRALGARATQGSGRTDLRYRRRKEGGPARPDVRVVRGRGGRSMASAPPGWSRRRRHPPDGVLGFVPSGSRDVTAYVGLLGATRRGHGRVDG